MDDIHNISELCVFIKRVLSQQPRLANVCQKSSNLPTVMVWMTSIPFLIFFVHKKSAKLATWANVRPRSSNLPTMVWAFGLQ